MRSKRWCAIAAHDPLDREQRHGIVPLDRAVLYSLVNLRHGQLQWIARGPLGSTNEVQNVRVECHGAWHADLLFKNDNGLFASIIARNLVRVRPSSERCLRARPLPERDLFFYAPKLAARPSCHSLVDHASPHVRDDRSTVIVRNHPS